MSKLDTRWCHDPTILSSLSQRPLQGREREGRGAPSRAQKLPEGSSVLGCQGTPGNRKSGAGGRADLTPSWVEAVLGECLPERTGGWSKRLTRGPPSPSTFWPQVSTQIGG